MTKLSEKLIKPVTPTSWADFQGDHFQSFPDGEVVQFNGVQFVRDRSADIAGLGAGPGWKPYGEVTARHFGSSVNSDSLNSAADYVRVLGGGVILTRDEWGESLLSDTVDISGVTMKGGRFRHGSGSSHLFETRGSLTPLGSILAAASRGDNTVTLSDTTGVASGVFLLITATDSYATTDAGYKSGEVVEVASVSGSVVTLNGSIQGRIDRSAYPIGSLVRIVNYVKGGSLHGVTVAGDWEAKGAVFYASCADKPEVKDTFVSDHGNLAIRFHTTRGGKLTGGRIQRLRMDIPDGRSAYAMALTGSDYGFVMDGVVTDLTRHAFTTMGGSDGFPRKFVVKNCVDFNSLSGSYDTHAAGADYEISNCTSFDSAGSAFGCRAPYGVYHGNTAVRPATRGVLMSENVLSDVTISAFNLSGGPGVGISCSEACNNLRLLDNILVDSKTYAIRLFNSATAPSSGTIIKGNILRNWGVETTGLAGIQIDGTQANTGVLIDSNVFQAETPGIARAVRLVSMTGGTVQNNTASGSYSATVFDLGNFNRRINNMTLGALADQVGPAANSPEMTMTLVNSIRASLIALGVVRQ